MEKDLEKDMVKVNQVFPSTGEEETVTEDSPRTMTEKSPLLHKMRENYQLFGGLSFVFGLLGTALFYKAGIGINSFLFTVVMIGLLIIISNRLKIKRTKGTYYCYIGAALLGISNMLTANESLHFLSSIGILLLLEISLIKQYDRNKVNSFTTDLLRIVELPFQIIASVGMPFIDCNRYVKNSRLLRNDKIRNILIGCILAIPFLLVISALLSSADLMFNKFTSSFYRSLFTNDIYQIILFILIGFTLCYSIICGALRDSDRRLNKKTMVDPVIAITVTSLLLILYMIFCGIQAFYLFAGGLFQLPVEFTYAEYARRGFFELLAVTCFNIILMLICMNVFEESRILKGILTAITACTYIMIASATYRMFLYIGAYHLTFLRMIVLLFLLIDSFLLAGVIITVYHKQFPLFGYGVAVVSVCYILFSFSKPDYIIADYFIKNHEELTQDDLRYLAEELSYDAAPVVISFLDHLKDNLEAERIVEVDHSIIASTIQRYHEKAAKEVDRRGIRDYNWSYVQAKHLTK